MSDEVIECSDCGTSFPFTVSEATFFTSKGLSKPRRCKPCRQKRKDAKGVVAGTESPSRPETPDRGGGRTQWVGGGEAEVTRSVRGIKRDRRHDRDSDDHSF
jgi:hypothetical protein